MKKLFVSLLFCSASIAVMAQRAKVISADEAFKNKDLEKAKSDIETALQHEKTKNDAKAWYVKGKVFEELATKNKSAAQADTAFEAFKKALDINPKLPDALLELNQRMFNVYATIANQGYANLNDQQWDSSYRYFKKAFDVADYYNSKNVGGSIPRDTSMIFYAGYSAHQAGLKDEAFVNLKEAMKLKFHTEPALFVVLAQQYEERGDNANWIGTIDSAKKYFPTDKRFNDMEMLYYSKTGKTAEMLGMLEKKVLENPNDVAMLLDYAIRVDNVANPRDPKNGEDLPKPSNYDELMAKAEASYKKVLDMKPDDATANFQLGALYFNRAVAFNKELNAMESKDQGTPKGKALQAKMEELMNQALPFFEKADQGFSAQGKLEAGDRRTYESALYALQKIYAIKSQNDKVEEVRKKLQNL